MSDDPVITIWTEEPILLLNDREDILNDTENWTNEGNLNWKEI